MAAYAALPESGKMAVAYMVAFSWKAFNANFGSAEAFLERPRPEQIDYLVKLADFETSLLNDGKKLEALGPALLKMYLAPLIEGDHHMANKFADQLEPLNEKGSPMVWASSGGSDS